MKPAKPFHINFPTQYANGRYAPNPQYEVVGHRDGPVVARFPFDPSELEYQEQALAEAEALVRRSEDRGSPRMQAMASLLHRWLLSSHGLHHAHHSNGCPKAYGTGTCSCIEGETRSLLSEESP